MLVVNADWAGGHCLFATASVVAPRSTPMQLLTAVELHG